MSWVADIQSGVAGGKDAWSATKCIDFESGVVAHGSGPGGLTDCNRLQSSIALEIGSILHDVTESIRTRTKVDKPVEDTRNLDDLVRIGASADKAGQKPSATRCSGGRCV